MYEYLLGGGGCYLINVEIAHLFKVYASFSM